MAECAALFRPTLAFDSGSSRTPAGRSAGVAFEAGAVADQGEVAAFLTAVAFATLDPCGADALEAKLGRVLLRRCYRDGERAVDAGALPPRLR